MKNDRFLPLPICVAFVTLILATPSFLQAQINNPGQLPPGKTLSSAPALPYCDEAVPAALRRIQASADEKCETTHACVPCIDRASNKGSKE